MAQLIHEFIVEAAAAAALAPALACQGRTVQYGALADAVGAAAAMLLALGIGRGERVAVYLEKREEAVFALFGAAAAGAVFVPVNPLLKPAQVVHILNDCTVRILVTSADRLPALAGALTGCAALHTVIVTDAPGPCTLAGQRVLAWPAQQAPDAASPVPHRSIDTDVAAILYTSGSTGAPKGVVLSHRNLVAGALSVASYLGNHARDRLLCVLPLSFDYGLSQLTTAFASGACAVLMNYLLPRDILAAVLAERITGLAGVPPLWIQLAQLTWPAGGTLRYITNSGGVMPAATLHKLRTGLPQVAVYLMYGLTEAFRSTYLAPDQLDRRPGSIGKAIPNAEVLVLRPDGSECDTDEPGELVHRGALVGLGYWNDPARTAERYKPLPPAPDGGPPLAELAVWSGDTVRRDADGYLYFVGRRDDMIKSAGYRISPGEIEEVIHASGLAGEVAALGVAHPLHGQAIVLLATRPDGAGAAALDARQLMAVCKATLPGFMLPLWIDIRHGPLPRNPNGKIDRKLLALELAPMFWDAVR